MSKNQWYNKRVAALTEGQPQGFWSKQLAAIPEKRNCQMRDAINKAAVCPNSHRPVEAESISALPAVWHPIC
ncbi:hypothetical protein JX360_08500 [Synechococcus bigranulatus str. 'Rupite']|uniref:Uncharacterized protein n=1 Tax=Thermostichus vulcanus str. 'Rupite' TaxID=2813851 RepID=A0ABT0CAY4_THEVL|nr:hypothetical protein [Thermostichus vulcanus]MCJ2542944.1 hypothetical protein [Thermostichus vulcanus str. 'Rupite']